MFDPCLSKEETDPVNTHLGKNDVSFYYLTSVLDYALKTGKGVEVRSY